MYSVWHCFVQLFGGKKIFVCVLCHLGEISMSVITGWGSDNDEEDRAAGEKSIPVEQDPLGSSAVPPDHSQQ